MIILIEENVWSCYSDCYSTLHVWRATVANLKKKLELPSLLECLFCVNSVYFPPKFGFTESVGDALTYQILSQAKTKEIQQLRELDNKE